MNLNKIALGLLGVVVLAQSAMAQGVYSGSKEGPMPAIFGYVEKIVSKGPPVKLERTKIEVKFSRVYYEGVVEAGGLAKPTSGEVQEVYIGDIKVSLLTNDLGKGFLDTKDFGKIAVYFSSSLTSDSCTLAVTAEQLKNIQAKVKNVIVK